MHDIPIIPFPAKHNFLIGLKVTEGEDAKRNCIVFVGLGVPAGLAENRAENSVGSAAAADETRLVPGDSSIQCDVERRAEKVDVWLGHAEMGVGV